MSKNLVIVESPGKIKTISKALGKDFHVMASQGHIRDIEGVGKNSMGIDFEHGYSPHYAIDPKKTRLIESLKSETEKADTIWLASDEDREGEAIAWHLSEVLELDKKDTKRIVFHEITPTAIKEAIQHPRGIDYNMVDAQQARRVIDRIVGFELSPVLWHKLIPGLSAGRVQSVAVRLIVEKEREVNGFNTIAQYRINADFVGTDINGEEFVLPTELSHRFATKEGALMFLEQCKNSRFTVKSVSSKPIKRSPAPPFTTSLLQQEAGRKLHFPVSKTMRLAQSLYEAGCITYMRTDSVNLSQLAINTAKTAIEKEYGERYHKARQYKTTAKGAQEAHEAIRPTYIEKVSEGATEDEKKLYTLIRRRTLASQMADAEIEKTTIEVVIDNSPYIFNAVGEVVMFDGFMRAYVQSTDDEQDTQESRLPKIEEGISLNYKQINATESFNKTPSRYTEPSLVKKMEELGIGRPSTYSTIIDTIIARKYVQKGNIPGKKRDITILSLRGGKISEKQKSEAYGAEAQKLLPTDLGFMTNDFLVEDFPQILNYDFTAQSEKSFDEIAAGEENWVEVVDHFYKTFHPSIMAVSKGRIEGRYLGIDPRTGKQVMAKIGKMGPCIQIGTAKDADKPSFASLQKDQSIYTITLKEALALFNTPYPYNVGEYEGKEMVVADGRFGPYIKHDNLFYSVPAGFDPAHLTTDDAIAIIERKRQSQMPLKEFGEIKVMNGRFGPYIKYKDENYKIPRGTDIDSLSEERCQAIIADPEASSKRKSTSKRKTTRTASTKKTTKTARK